MPPSCLSGAAAEHDGVEQLSQLVGRIVLADLAVGDEGDALGLEEIDAALDETLVELHVGNAVH